MLTYFKRLLTDEGAFMGFARAALGGFALLSTEGEVLKGMLSPEAANLVGAAALAAALFMRSSSSAAPK
jgi:hypothetical protein